jgi:hypothetical protein
VTVQGRMGFTWGYKGDEAGEDGDHMGCQKSTGNIIRVVLTDIIRVVLTDEFAVGNAVCLELWRRTTEWVFVLQCWYAPKPPALPRVG